VVGGDLDLASLTEIPKWFNPKVGDNLWLSILTEIPENWNPTNIKGEVYINNDYSGIKPIINFINFNI